MRELWQSARDTVKVWSEAQAPRAAAALAFYTAFSVTPLLLLAIAGAALLMEEAQARERILWQIERLIGPTGAEAVKEMIVHARKPGAGWIATGVGVASLLLGASAVFGELQQALNAVWGVRKRLHRGLAGAAKDRFLSFALVLGIGFLLLVSLLLSAAVAATGDLLRGGDPARSLVLLLQSSLSFAVVFALFAALFKVVPDIRAAWRDVAGGAFLTTLMFEAGKAAIGEYLGRSSIASAYGAAGSLAVFLLDRKSVV